MALEFGSKSISFFDDSPTSCKVTNYHTLFVSFLGLNEIYDAVAAHLGKPVSAKMDEFPEKVRRGGVGDFLSEKIHRIFCVS